jgi:hypothetical protein
MTYRAYVVTATLLLAACGTTSRVVSTGATEPLPSIAPVPASTDSRDSSASSPTPPPSSGPVKPPSISAVPAIAPPTNRNIRKSALGQLCWARREVVLLVVRAVSGEPGKTSESMDASTELLPVLDAALGEVESANVDRLAGPVAAFAARFASDLRLARSAWTSAPRVQRTNVVNAFDFENYPGVKEYLAAAGTDAGCLDP